MRSQATPAPTASRRARDTQPPVGRGRANPPASHRSTWRRLNTWGGYLLLGVPAAAAIPALAATVARFGLWSTVAGAALPALATVGPLAAWITYTHRRPTTARAALAWIAAAIALLTLLWFSPLFFGVGPALALLISEVARVLFARRRATWAARREEATR